MFYQHELYTELDRVNSQNKKVKMTWYGGRGDGRSIVKRTKISSV